MKIVLVLRYTNIYNKWPSYELTPKIVGGLIFNWVVMWNAGWINIVLWRPRYLSSKTLIFIYNIRHFQVHITYIFSILCEVNGSARIKLFLNYKIRSNHNILGNFIKGNCFAVGYYIFNFATNFVSRLVMSDT